MAAGLSNDVECGCNRDIIAQRNLLQHQYIWLDIDHRILIRASYSVCFLNRGTVGNGVGERRSNFNDICIGLASCSALSH